MQHGIFPQNKWDLNDLQAPYPKGPPNNESKESGTCSNLRVAAIWSCFPSEGSRPVVSHLGDICGPNPIWINSWAELPPRGQHALCSSGGASQGTPGQVHDLHQLQLKSCTAISGVTHGFRHSEDVLVWMHTIEMGVHLIDTNSMVEFNLPLGSDQWHQNFGRTCAPHQAQIPSLQKIARKDQRQEKDKSREAVCILFIKRKFIGK